MKSIALSDTVSKNRYSLNDYLNDMDNNWGKDFNFLSNAFNKWQWTEENRFSFNEKATYKSYNPEDEYVQVEIIIK
jgi:hypothetical protein